jgi:uncharacterized protein (UPF0264 family)
MNPLRFHRNTPGLLVSVRSAEEAVAALAGGADVIDVKEPEHGPLGAADAKSIAHIVQVVAGRVPVTAAAGELLDVSARGAMRTLESLPSGVSLYKIGLHGCRDVADWKARWHQAASRCDIAAHCARPVAVVYADWRSARSPEPSDVLQIAVEYGCPALLIDTWDKSAGNLFEHWTMKELVRFISQARAHPMAVVLAGSLGASNIATAVRLAPDLVAVRGAACDNGRSGTISAKRVAHLRQTMVTAATATSKAAPSPVGP